MGFRLIESLCVIYLLCTQLTRHPEIQIWCGRRDLNPQAFWALAPKANFACFVGYPYAINC